MNIRKLGRLDTLIESQREKGKLQGATIVVEHKGKRVYENHYEPDREDSIIRLRPAKKSCITSSLISSQWGEKCLR